MPLPTNQTRSRWHDRKPSVLFCDVNETLLDIEALGRPDHPAGECPLPVSGLPEPDVVAPDLSTPAARLIELGRS